jgi:hypothetical protein
MVFDANIYMMEWGNRNPNDDPKRNALKNLDEFIDELNFDSASNTARIYRKMTPEQEKLSDAYLKAADFLLNKGYALLAFKAAGLGGVDLRSWYKVHGNWSIIEKSLKENKHTLEDELKAVPGDEVTGIIMDAVKEKLDKYFRVRPFMLQDDPFEIGYYPQISNSVLIPPTSSNIWPHIAIGKDCFLDPSAYAEEYAHYLRWKFTHNSGSTGDDIQEFFGGLARLYLGGVLYVENLERDTANLMLDGDLKCIETQKVCNNTFEAMAADKKERMDRIAEDARARMQTIQDDAKARMDAIFNNTRGYVQGNDILDQIKNAVEVRKAKNEAHRRGYSWAEQVKAAGNLELITEINLNVISLPDFTIQDIIKRKGGRRRFF